MIKPRKRASRLKTLTPEEMIVDPVMGPLLIKFRCAVLGVIGWPQECCDNLERAMMEDMFPDIWGSSRLMVEC